MTTSAESSSRRSVLMPGKGFFDGFKRAKTVMPCGMVRVAKQNQERAQREKAAEQRSHAMLSPVQRSENDGGGEGDGR